MSPLIQLDKMHEKEIINELTKRGFMGDISIHLDNPTYTISW